jgi:predicted alpha/beta hydrolase family esterase
MSRSVILPGIYNSGETHWQTHWEAADPYARRLRPSDWDRPDLDDWIAALDRAIADAGEPPLLVVHSLACLLVAHWAGRTVDAAHRVRGAFLVSVPDPNGPAFPIHHASTFARPIPLHRLPFAALVVASSNDPYASSDHARSTAAAWGAGFVLAGALGHINEASGLGCWPQGAALFEAFRTGTGAAAMPRG